MRGSTPSGYRDVGSHRDSPTIAARTGLVQQRKQGGRDDHPTQCRAHWQRGAASIIEFSFDQFSFDLQADHEEEQHH